MSLYTSIGGVRKELTKLYAGVGGTARQLTSFLAGVDGTKKELLPSQITYRWIQYNAIASTTTGKTGRAIYNYILRGDIALDGGEEIQTLYLTESEFFDWTYGDGEFGQDYIMMQSGNDIEKLEFVGWETTTTTTYRQGSTNYGYVYSTNYNAYPDNGYQGGYWYVRSSGSGGGDSGGGTGGDSTCSHSNTKTEYTEYSSTQHTVTKTCKDCGVVISSTKASHSLNYGTAYTCPDCGTAVQRQYCSLCGYEKTGSHSC